MQQSNIFAYVELSKFAEGLTLNVDRCRSDLLALHAFFKIIPSKMFSQELAAEWEAICQRVSRSGPKVDDQGRITINDIRNTITQMETEECFEVVKQIYSLKQKVAAEFN